jgi:hypothetical protein
MTTPQENDHVAASPGRAALAAEDDDHLGGRLALLAADDLDAAQREVYDGLAQTVVPEAAQHGFTARLDDGRFIGPFNAMLRPPAITMGMGAWEPGWLPSLHPAWPPTFVRR